LNQIFLYASNFQGQATGWLNKGSWNVPASGPTAVSVTPASGTGLQQLFAFQVSDAAGYTNISGVLILIGPALSPTNSCYISYNSANNSVSLASDVGTWLTPVALGNSATTENSRCQITPATSSAVGSGTVLTFTLDVRFKSASLGLNQIFLYASDFQGQATGWLNKGSWNVP
jgi:hypothetical protein